MLFSQESKCQFTPKGVAVQLPPLLLLTYTDFLQLFWNTNEDTVDFCSSNTAVSQQILFSQVSVRFKM